jgi:hypothetical protein
MCHNQPYISFKTQLLLDEEALIEAIKECRYQLAEEGYKMTSAHKKLWRARIHNFNKARAKIKYTLARL